MRTGQRLPERRHLEADPVSGPLEQAPASFYLRVDVVTPVAGRLELLLCDLPSHRIEIRGLDLALQPIRVPVADATPHPPLHVVIYHLRQAAEFALDGFSLADEHLQHAVLDALRQHEIVATHLGRGLQLAVDATVALLDAARVPRQIEVKQVGAVGLEVEALPRRVRRQQDP